MLRETKRGNSKKTARFIYQGRSGGKGFYSWIDKSSDITGRIINLDGGTKQ